MGLVAVGEREAVLQVSSHGGIQLDGGVDLTLEGLLLGVGAGRLGLGGLEEALLALGDGDLLLLEELVVNVGAELDTRDVDLGGGGDDVRLVDAPERDTVDGVGACSERRRKKEKRRR